MNAAALTAHLAAHASGGVADRLEYPIGRNVGEMAEEWGLDYDATGVVFCAIAVDMTNMDLDGANYQEHPAGAPATAYMSYGEGAAMTFSSHGQLGAVASDEDKNFIEDVHGAANNAKQWIADLVAAFQVRDLKGKNIAGYFMSMSNTRVVGATMIPLIRYAAARLPKVMSHVGLRNILSDGVWVEYHTSATSTPSLVSKMIEGLGGDADLFLSAGTQAVVTNAVAAPYDRALADLIPRPVLAMAYVWMQVNNKDFGSWYQGEKAYSDAPVTMTNAWRSGFSRMKVIGIDADAIGDASTSAAVADALPASAKGL
jgi:hypothetical protein